MFVIVLSLTLVACACGRHVCLPFHSAGAFHHTKGLLDVGQAAIPEFRSLGRKCSLQMPLWHKHIAGAFDGNQVHINHSEKSYEVVVLL